MDDHPKSDAGLEEDEPNLLDPSCSCVQDPFNSLPPELRPKPKPIGGGLRQAICPGCGLKFWTNRKTDFCFDCEKTSGAKS